MDVPAPTLPGAPAGRYSSEQYLRLIDDGVLGPEDHVELLEGVVVAVAAQSALHASGVTRAMHTLVRVVGDRAVVRSQLAFIAGGRSVPEPDVAVVPGRLADYDRVHPHLAHLVVEVADSSLAQDRLTKAAIYAGAGVPEHWIVDLRGQRVEVHRVPDPKARRYRDRSLVRRGDTIALSVLEGALVAVTDLLPAVDG
jgi:Uma2 family endonuclease